MWKVSKSKTYPGFAVGLFLLGEQVEGIVFLIKEQLEPVIQVARVRYLHFGGGFGAVLSAIYKDESSTWVRNKRSTPNLQPRPERHKMAESETNIDHWEREGARHFLNSLSHTL